jgi:PTH1 family peptidyl-tRNA hydrolase
MFYIFGLGNPGDEYLGTRHNVGRDAVSLFAKNNDFDDFQFDKKSNSLVSIGKFGKEKVTLCLPQGFMNNSGKTIGYFVKTKPPFLSLIVVHDDLDLPVGRIKVSFGKKSGGHRGVESVAKTLKTKDFIRVRVGISKHTPSGKIKKPQGEKEVIDFILSKLNKKDIEDLKKNIKNGSKALETILSDGFSMAMNIWNQSV